MPASLDLLPASAFGLYADDLLLASAFGFYADDLLSASAFGFCFRCSAFGLYADDLLSASAFGLYADDLLSAFMQMKRTIKSTFHHTKISILFEMCKLFADF